MRSVFFITLLLLLSSCASRRQVTTHAYVSDTTHVVVSDTSTIVNVRDSVHVTDREVIHERIVTIYDPSTGHPVEQTIERDIDRMRDSLYTHLRDSLLRAISFDAFAAHLDSLRHEEQHSTGQAALSPWQAFAHRFSTLFVVLLTSLFIYVAVRSFKSS